MAESQAQAHGAPSASALESAAQRLKPAQNALPAGSRMGEFEIIGLVGEGGFGIVYLAHDHSLQRRVALKEYMPASLAARNPNGSISVRSEQHLEAFAAGRSSFVNEARLLAQFDHPALVKVFRFWEANGTAYMVMPLYVGKTLRQIMHERPSLDEAWIKRFLAPILDALEVIHRDNCFHRDISPDNILLLPNDKPVLLDFGAARRVIGDMTQALTVFVKHSYAPIEQYAEMPELKQGAWTDIYTLSALVYFMIARKLPPPSVGRVVQDSYEPLVKRAAGRYSEGFLTGLDICLRVRPEQRPQNIAEMRTLLGINSKARSKSTSRDPEKEAEPRRSRRRSHSRKPVPQGWRAQLMASLPTAAFIGTLLALGGAAYYVGQRSVSTANSTPVPALSAPAPLSATPVAPVSAPPAASLNPAGKETLAADTPRTTAQKPTSAAKSKTKAEAKEDKGETPIVGAAKSVAKGAKSVALGVAGWAKRTFAGSSKASGAGSAHR